MSAWWPGWLTWWSSGPPPPMKTTDAIRHPALRMRFSEFLDHTNPPATFRAAEVAQALSFKELQTMGYEKWQEVLPAVVELAFELREMGDCEILKGGKVLGMDVSAYEIEGSVRIRRSRGPGLGD